MYILELVKFLLSIDIWTRILQDTPHGVLVWLPLWWNMAYPWPSNSTLVTAFVTRNLFPWQTLWHFHSSCGHPLPNCLIFHGCPIRQYVLLFLSLFLRPLNASYASRIFWVISTSTIWSYYFLLGQQAKMQWWWFIPNILIGFILYT